MRWLRLGVAAAAVLTATAACKREPEECLVANRCHRGSCSGPIVRTGCGACQAGEINDDECRTDAAALGRDARRSPRTTAPTSADRARIELAGLDLAVLHAVGEHVDEGVTYLGRCRQVVSVIAVAPHAAPPAPQHVSIETPRRADREGSHPAREQRLRLRLDDEMHVIGLHRVVHDTKALALAAAHDLLQEVGRPLLAEAWQPPLAPQRDVHRHMPLVLGAPQMRDLRPLPLRPARPFAPPAPPHDLVQSLLRRELTHSAWQRRHPPSFGV